jgi:hypothetical protein
MGHLQDGQLQRAECVTSRVTRQRCGSVLLIGRRVGAADKQVFPNCQYTSPWLFFFLCSSLNIYISRSFTLAISREQLCQQFGIGNTGADHHLDRARIESATLSLGA